MEIQTLTKMATGLQFTRPEEEEMIYIPLGLILLIILLMVLF